MTHLETERRWLVSLPLHWFAKFKIIYGSKKQTIYQTYLKENGINNSRVRAITYKNGCVYSIKRFYTTKKYVSFGVCEEFEIPLSDIEYKKKLTYEDTTKNRIEKDRFVFDFKDQEFELDIFMSHLTGLAILELELPYIDFPVILPPFLKIEKELTGNDTYSNNNLARLENWQ